jgi:hypothetical protein
MSTAKLITDSIHGSVRIMSHSEVTNRDENLSAYSPPLAEPGGGRKSVG